MEKVSSSTVRTSAIAIKTSIVEISPNRLRGVGKKGAKLGVRYKITNTGETNNAVVAATGPWQFIEGDTRAHRIPRARTRGKRRVVVIPGVGIRAYADHPGTKGKHLFRKGAVAGMALAGRIQQAETAAALKAIF